MLHEYVHSAYELLDRKVEQSYPAKGEVRSSPSPFHVSVDFKMW